MMKIILILSIVLASNLSALEPIYFLNSNQEPERQAVIRYLMDAFELEYPEYKVELQFYNENDSLSEILQEGKSEKPHLVMADSRLLMRLSRQRDLDIPFTAHLMGELQDDMYRGAKDAFSGREGYFGLPFSAWLQVLWYRADWFEQKDLKPPETLEDLLQAAETFYTPEARTYGLVIGKAQDSYMEQCFLQLSAANGVRLHKERQPYLLNRAPFNETLRLYRQLSRFTPPGKVNWRYRDYFFQNRAAMLFYSTFLMDDLALEKVMADSLGSVHFPDLEGVEYNPEFFDSVGMVTTIAGVEDSSFGSISGIGVFEGRSEKETRCIDALVRFLYRPDVYISWLHMSPGGMLPVKSRILEEDEFYKDNLGVFSRYGRRKILDLAGGLDHLKILNPEELLYTPENGYNDHDFLKLIYTSLQIQETEDLMSTSPGWMK